MTNRIDRLIRKFNVAGTEFSLRIDLDNLPIPQAMQRLHDVLERKHVSIILSFLFPQKFY